MDPDPDTANDGHAIELAKERVAKEERKAHYLLTIRSQRAVQAQYGPRAGFKVCGECSGGCTLDNGQRCSFCNGLGQVRQYVYEPPPEEELRPCCKPLEKCGKCGWPTRLSSLCERDGKPICIACALRYKHYDEKEKKDASD